MVLAFDATRAPLREDEFVDLVRAVAGARDGDESHWIEWKGTLDVRSPDGKAAVARCVVGLANRLPDTAARFCEGRGYLVIGAEPGRIVDIPEEDPANLTQWWTPYLGTDGPRWVPHWVAVDGATVLVLEVAAPRKGDPIFTIRKEMSGTVRDGDVFLRRTGKTERATSSELAALVDRAAGARVLAGVAVTLERPTAVRPVDFGPEALEAWVTAVREGAMESLYRAQHPTPDPTPTKALQLGQARSGSGPTISELKALEQRMAEGETLTDEESARLEVGREQVRRAMSSISQVMSAQLGAF